MEKTTTSKTQKTDVAKKPTVAAAKPAVTEKVESVAEVKTDAATAEKIGRRYIGRAAESQEAEKTAVTENKEEDKSGLPFKVNSDGTVNVWSVKRTGRSVTGSTGEVVTFDDEGFAKVKLEDALHFKDVPGFSFSDKE